jgi:hypothetical protein
LQLLGLVLVLAGWRLSYLEEAAWLEWLALAGALCVDAGLAWVTQPRAGLTVLLLGTVALPAASVLAELRCRSGLAPRPSRANGVLAFVAGLLAPAAGLLLAPTLAAAIDRQGFGPPPCGEGVASTDPAAGLALLRDTVRPDDARAGVPGFAAGEVGAWTWGLPWAVLPLAGFGLLRSYLRGRRQKAEARVPLAWALLGYAAAVFVTCCLRPDSVHQAGWLPLASLATFLAVFAVGDLLRGLVQRLQLTPPGELSHET